MFNNLEEFNEILEDVLENEFEDFMRVKDLLKHD